MISQSLSCVLIATKATIYRRLESPGGAAGSVRPSEAELWVAELFERSIHERRLPDVSRVSPVSQPESSDARNTAIGDVARLCHTARGRLRLQLLLEFTSDESSDLYALFAELLGFPPTSVVQLRHTRFEDWLADQKSVTEYRSILQTSFIHSLPFLAAQEPPKLPDPHESDRRAFDEIYSKGSDAFSAVPNALWSARISERKPGRALEKDARMCAT
jgi:hypothetical protein